MRRILDWKTTCVFIINTPVLVLPEQPEELFMVHFVQRDDKDNRKTEYAKLTDVKCDGFDATKYSITIVENCVAH